MAPGRQADEVARDVYRWLKDKLERRRRMALKAAAPGPTA